MNKQELIDFEDQIPQMGEIKRACDLGIKDSHKYIWVTCKKCGNSRWVSLRKGNPTSNVCSDCNCHTKNKKNITTYVEGQEPKLGDIRRTLNSRGNYCLKEYLACPQCGIRRWVNRKKGISKVCPKCAFSVYKKETFIGATHPAWKGGRMIDKHTGYVFVTVPNHPKHGRQNYVLEHRWIMEQSIGRYLLHSEHVHHKNGIKDDNRIENLELISPSNHRLRTVLCGQCILQKDFRVLREENKWLKSQLQLKLQNRT